MTNISLEQKQDLEKAYAVLKEKISKSNTYVKFLSDNLEELQTIIMELNTANNKKDNPETIIEDIKNVDIINECSNYLNIDKEFSNAIMKGTLTDNLITNIVNIKFIETLYGNPNKEDLNVNDVLFVILESVFGLDTLTKSVYDDNVLLTKFRKVMYPCENEESYNFVNLINKIYEEAKEEKEYDKILEIIRNYRQDLIPYISAGINNIINDITNDSTRSFSESDMLLRQVMDIIGKTDTRKM